MLVNVIVDNAVKAQAMQDEDLLKKGAEIEKQMAGNGRVLLRASGTEPLMRIMLEGQDEKQILDQALSLAHVIVNKYNGKIKA